MILSLDILIDYILITTCVVFTDIHNSLLSKNRPVGIESSYISPMTDQLIPSNHGNQCSFPVWSIKVMRMNELITYQVIGSSSKAGRQLTQSHFSSFLMYILHNQLTICLLLTTSERQKDWSCQLLCEYSVSRCTVQSTRSSLQPWHSIF